VGLSAFNVGQNVLLSLSAARRPRPPFWLNPQNGVVYNIAVSAPQHSIDSIDSLLNMPVAATGAARPLRRPSCSATWSRRARASSLPVVSRYNITPAVDIYVSVQGTDLASVAGEVKKLVDEAKPKLPRGTQVVMRGQVETMQNSFVGLGLGLLMAIVLVYLLIVVNFQSWIDSAIVISALPAAPRRHRLDAVHHRHHALGAGAHRGDHDHGRGDRQLDPADLVRAPAARRRRRAARRGARRRRDAHPARC
jgi:hypothetical protein